MKVVPQKNCDFFQQLLVLLQSGYPLHEILLLLGEGDQHQELQEKTFIEIYILPYDNYFYRHLKFLINYLPLTTAIQYSLALETFRHHMITNIAKKIAYPLFLFASSNLLLIVFLWYIYPQITSNFPISPNHTWMHSLIIIFLGIIMSLSIGLILAICILYILRLLEHPWYPLLLLEISYRIPIGRRYFSLVFLYYFLYLQNSGLPSKDIILFLQKLRCNRVTDYVITNIHQQLITGEDFLHAIEHNRFLHPEVKMIFKLKITCKEQIDTTEHIIQFQLLKLQNAIQQLTISCSIIAYFSMFLMIITVYQFLLIPLEMIKEF